MTPKIQCPVPDCLVSFRRDKDADFRNHANKIHTGHDLDFLTSQFKGAGKTKLNPNQRLCPKNTNPIPLTMANCHNGQQSAANLPSPVAMASNIQFTSEQFEGLLMSDSWSHSYRETDFQNMDELVDYHADPVFDDPVKESLWCVRCESRRQGYT